MGDHADKILNISLFIKKSLSNVEKKKCQEK